MIFLESALNVVVAVIMTMGMSIEDQDLQKEVYCGAQNIYHESRGEPNLGQVAVAHVVRNRISSEHYPDSVCSVIWEPAQFSWTKDGKSDHPDMVNKINRDAFIKSVWLHLMANDNVDITGGATHYYAHDKVYPDWAKKMVVTTVIGNHTFGYIPGGK